MTSAKYIFRVYTPIHPHYTRYSESDKNAIQSANIPLHSRAGDDENQTERNNNIPFVCAVRAMYIYDPTLLDAYNCATRTRPRPASEGRRAASTP